MKVTVIGTGYVGLVTGTCLAESGNVVTCMDIDPDKIAMLRRGQVPIYEPGLEDLVETNAKAGRLHFTNDISEAVSEAAVVIIAVGTPPGEDGGADLQHVLAAAASIGQNLSGPTVVVNKSTVPVGTVEKVHEAVSQSLAQRGVRQRFAVLSNPEFLKEGVAIKDFMHPDRIIIGGEDAWAIDRLQELYAPFVERREQILVTDSRSAELTKYAANAMLATRISFMNELANLAEAVGADITLIRAGIASDPRIGPEFLNAGCGYGGSCFPKDVKALIRFGQREGHEMNVVRGVDVANEAQKQVLFRKLRDFYQTRGGLKGKTIALWGLAFKPNTDDMREAPSVALIQELVDAGAHIRAYDPIAMSEARRVLGDVAEIEYCDGPNEAVEGSDALVVVTEWQQFRQPDFGFLAARLHDRYVVDGRNIYDPELAVKAGLTFASIGRRELNASDEAGASRSSGYAKAV